MSSKKRSLEQVKLARTYHVAKSDTDSAIYDFLSALDCPKSLAIWLLFKTGEHQQLVEMDIDPHHYIDAMAFRDAYAAYCFLSKADFFKLEVSKKDAALAKFFKYEEQCKQTNLRFMNPSFDPLNQGSNVWLLSATTRKIEQILGEFSPEEFVDQANWGPGVSTLLKGEHVSAVNKFHSENGITRDLYSLVETWFPVAYPLWSQHLVAQFGGTGFNHQVGNTIVTVPKNSKTDRVIAVEPGINLWFQKGIGTMIKKRLRRRGVDLSSQVRNQQLARRASKDASLATVDFSSASDSIARELVRTVLPPNWYQLLDACRTPLGVHGKSILRWQKFSSMGNGFTFELESLIFYAAALAVCDFMDVSSTDVNVFGDDVIIPNRCFELFSSFSAFLGFTVNQDKSFNSSGFRESCGAHWFDGVDCKPIFLKERLSNVQSIYKLANSVRFFAHRRCSYNGCDSQFRSTWYHLLKRVPKPLRFGISHGFGDAGFAVNFDEATPSVARDGFEGSYASGLIELGVTQEFDKDGMLLARLKNAGRAFAPYGVRNEPNRLIVAFNRQSQSRHEQLCSPTGIADIKYSHDTVSFGRLTDSAYGNMYTLRGVTRLKVSRLLIPQWYNLGPWM